MRWRCQLATLLGLDDHLFAVELAYYWREDRCSVLFYLGLDLLELFLCQSTTRLLWCGFLTLTLASGLQLCILLLLLLIWVHFD